MHRYIIKRLLLMIPTILGVIFIVFTIMSFTPGDPGRIMLGVKASPEAVEAMNEKLGYNKPFFERFFMYIGRLLKGDLGNSYKNNQPVFDEIMKRFPTTFNIAVLAVSFVAIVGIPLGVFSAVKQYSLLDYSTTIFSLIFAAAPSFWLGLLSILLFSLVLGWLPPNGIGSFKHYILPVVTLSLTAAAGTARNTRALMLEAIRQDYVRTARGKGASETRVIWKHTIKNALMPVITSMGMAFASLLGGTLVTEQVFGIPGLGTLIITAINNKDVPQVMAVTIFLSAIFCVIMLVVDLIYAYIDPQVKAMYTGKR
ncbi:MAG: ABC transporter permease [Clostridia bacterium]|nr:ABC transporter permease [Clostridia bacterium]